MKWIETETILEIHEQIIKHTGGSKGIKNMELLESALSTPLATFDGQELYPGFVKKVAVLLLEITNNHPFVDGNKRTAFVSALTLLASNDYEFSFEQQEVVNFMLKVAQGEVNYEQIYQWLKFHIERS